MSDEDGSDQEPVAHALSDAIAKLGIRPAMLSVPSKAQFAAEGKPSYCAFCGKDHKQAKKLVMGPSACICDECVMLASALLNAGAAHN